MVEFANLAYAFMTGIPGFGNSGFCMMDPEVMKKQRITYVRHWLGMLNSDLQRVSSAAKKS